MITGKITNHIEWIGKGGFLPDLRHLKKICGCHIFLGRKGPADSNGEKIEVPCNRYGERKRALMEITLVSKAEIRMYDKYTC